MENLNNELDLIAKNNQIDLNNLNKNNVYNMKKMMSNIEMFRNKLPKDGESIEDNATPEEIDKYFLAISNTLVKLEKNGNEGLKALSNWNTLLEVFNRLSQACEYLFENTLNSDDLAAIYEDIDNLYTLVYDILDFLSNLDLEGTLDDIYTQLSDLYSKYDSVLMVLKSIEDILEGIIASPLILLAASDTFEITTDGATTLTFNLVFDGIDATEQIVPTDIIVDDFALNGLFIAEDEYTITDKHVTDFNKIQIVIELNDPVVLESFNGEVKTQMALLQCLCNTKIVSAGAAPCTVLVTIQAVDGETNIPYISNTYYIDLSIILNGAYLSPMIDYTINRAADEPTGYVESIDFNYPIHGKLVILEKYVGFVINTMATTSSGSDSDNVLVVNTIETNWNEDILTRVLNDISGSVNYLRAEEIKADADIVALRTDMTTAQTDINALQSNDGAIESNITTLQNDVNLLETDVAGLHTSLATTDSKVATLEVDMDNAQADINNAEMNISNIVEDLATTDAKVATAVFTVNNIPPDANGNVNVEGGGSGGDMSNYYTKPESDARFAPIVHSHNEYSLTTHDHDSVYAALVHSHLEYAPVVHAHAITDITDLQAQLDLKAPIMHTHTEYALLAHTHVATEVTTDPDHQFVTQAEKDSWNAASGGEPIDAYTKTESDARFAPIVHTHAEYALDTDMTTVEGKVSTLETTSADHETRLDAIEAAPGGGLDQATADGLYVNVTGDTMTGGLSFDTPVSSSNNGLTNHIQLDDGYGLNVSNVAMNHIVPSGKLHDFIIGNTWVARIDANVNNSPKCLTTKEFADATYAALVHEHLEYAPTTHTHAIADVTNLQTELTSLDTRLDAVELKDSDYEKIANKGIANGYTPLDANNKVPLSFLNDSMVGNVKYLGLWDASTNSPALPATPTAQGEYYVTSVAGTQFSLEFQIGDWIIANGASWGKVDNTDAVSTVQGRTGNVTITKEDVGLTNVDDTSDLDKPVSTATQVALDAVNLEVDDHELRLVALEAGVLPEELTQIHPGAAIGSTTATLSQNAWDFEYLVWYSSSPSANDIVIWCRIHRGVTSDVSGSSIRSINNTDAPTVQTHFVQGTISSDGLTLTKPSDAGSLGGYIIFADNVVPQTLDNGVTYKIYGYKSASNKPTVISNEGGSVDADWITPTLGNNWVDYAGTTQPVGFRKTSDGTVLLHGAMKSDSLNGPVFTLPEGYRPASESFFAIATNTTGGFIGACKITTAGVVSITAGSTACVYMDGISFYAEQ